MTADAILMASGFSARFGGKNKLLAPFLGEPLALRTIRLACSLPALGNVFLIYADEAVASLADGTRTIPIKNTHPEHGARESVRLGAATSTADYLLFFPCDQPLLDAATVLAVLAAAKPGIIVSPAWQGRPGNPTLFSAAYRAELLSLAPGQHAREIKRRHPEAVRLVEATRPQALADADTPEGLVWLEDFYRTGAET